MTLPPAGRGAGHAGLTAWLPEMTGAYEVNRRENKEDPGRRGDGEGAATGGRSR